MVGNPKWTGGLTYVDLFGGPGVLKLRDTNRYIPGSTLLAAWTPKPFDRLIVCEQDREIAATCKTRLDRTAVANRTHFIVGNCNNTIEEVVSLIPDRSLTVAFVDPEGLHIHFETIKTLTTGRAVDLLILFTDRMDLHRNVKLYAEQEESNLDRFLGLNCNWRQALEALPNPSRDNVCKLFYEIYREQLSSELGYSVFADEIMRSQRSAIYRVIYASKNEKGLEFWNKISRIDRSGQQPLFPD